MSDETIDVGDLVVVVDGCCDTSIGKMFVVQEMAYGFFECSGGGLGCGHLCKCTIAFIPNVICQPVKWLKKIKPHKTEKTVETNEELHA